MMQKLFNVVSVVGCGYWGPNLIRNFMSLPRCQVKQVCDLDQERLTHVKQLYPEVDTIMDFAKLLDDEEVDAIIIATPVRLHFELAKKSLLAGKHTFIEKPMASSATQCMELIELAEKQRLTLMVGHTFIFSAAVRAVKEIVDSGYLGEVFYISSQRLNLGLFQKDINVAWDLAPHDISIILYLLNQSPMSVNCQGKAYIRPGIEDVINMSLDFPNGGLAIIHSSWLDPNKIRKMTIVGSKGMILYDDNEPLEKIKIYDKRVEIPLHYDTFAEFHYTYHYGDMRAPYIKQVEPLKVLCQHFLDCIRTGSKPQASGLEGLQIVQILEAASESLKNGGGKVIISDAKQRGLSMDSFGSRIECVP
jgi:predicted dehydrogenase